MYYLITYLYKDWFLSFNPLVQSDKTLSESLTSNIMNAFSLEIKHHEFTTNNTELLQPDKRSLVIMDTELKLLFV